MRIKLLTYHFSNNFGALLQAYALRKWFLQRGIEAEFINYHPNYVEDGGAFESPFNPRNCRKNLTILYLRVSQLRRRFSRNREQAQAFALFRRQELGVTGPRLKTLADLDGFDECDLLVCGSDQIWNPSIQRGLDPVYFLTFGDRNGTRRISYAASFGKSSLDPAYHEEAKHLLSALDAISVRELNGVEIVRAISGRDAECVPDPTILLGDFSDFLRESEKMPNGHVFCYALRTSNMIREVAQLVARDFQATILSPHNSHRRWPEIGETIYSAPDEWVRYLNNAAIVVTNSFHGVALSVILQKPFLAVTLPGKKSELNERIRNLLAQLDLQERLLDTADAESVRRVMHQDICWPAVARRLNSMRAAGNSFLESELVRIGSSPTRNSRGIQ